MSYTVNWLERNSGGFPRSFLTPGTTVDFGSAPTGVVVVIYGADAAFSGVKVGGTAGLADGAGYASGTLTLTDTTVAGSGLRVYKYFGAGIPTGAQPVHYDKTIGDANVGAVVFVFAGETDIGVPTIHAGTIAGSFSVTKTGTTSGRDVIAAGAIDLGSSNTATGTGGTTALMSSNGVTVNHWIALQKVAAGASTTLNASSLGSNYAVAAFEVVPAAPAGPVISTPVQTLTAINRTTAGATIDSGGTTGTMYALARTGGSAALSGPIISGGQNNATTGTGAKTVPNTVLAAGTANQYVDMVYVDATNGTSNVITVGPITTAAAVSVGASSAQSGTQGAAFSWTGATPAAGTTGGFGTVTYSLGAGSLPSGMSVNATTGALQGTPAASGTFSGVQIRGTDSGSPASTALGSAFTLTVAASGGGGGVKVPAVLLSQLLTPRS